MFGLRGKPLSDQYFAPLTDDFTAKGTAEIGDADTGQAWFHATGTAWTPTNTSRLSIINGKLTNTTVEVANRAGYVTANLGANVKKIGGSFVFAAGTGATHTGTAVFIIWKELLGKLSYIPNACCHFYITDVGWTFQVIENQVGATLASGSFDTPLTCDGATVYSANVEIVDTTATITLPDGNTATATDARIASLAGTYACFEVSQQAANTDPKAGFTAVYADVTVS